MRQLLIRLLLPCALFGLFVSSAQAATQAKQQMDYFLSHLESLQAQFEQSVLDADQKSASRSQGTLYLQKPGKFRWDYSEPDETQIIADGESIWMLDPELEQVSVQAQETALRGTPAMLLISGDPVENHFEVIDIGKSQGFDWVELIPRIEDGQFVRILLAFSDNQLRRMEMTDQFGQVSRFQFYDIVHNPKLDQALFVYERPLHYDLYTQ